MMTDLEEQLWGRLKEGFVKISRGCLIQDLPDDDVVVGAVSVHKDQSSKKPPFSGTS